MSYIDPNADFPGSNPSGQPYRGQQSQFSPPDSFSIPMVPANPYFRQRLNRRRGLRLGCLLTLVILIALLYAGYAAFAHNWPIFGPTTISVNTHSTLIINSQRYEKIDLPTIYIHAGSDANKMLFQVLSPGNVALPWNFGIDGFQQNSDSSVTVINGDPVAGRKLDVTVPPNTDLKLNTNSANIDVTGVTGQMTLITNDGTITLTHCNVNGTSMLADNTGTINVKESALNGQVTLSNNTGPITFNGAIGFIGTYAMVNNEGSIDVSLPQSSSFHLHAKTDTGLISTDFPGIQAQDKEVQADVGTSPHALLSFNTNTGTITLHVQRGA